MFNRKPDPAAVELDRTIAKIHAQMDEDSCETEEFAQMADQVVKLTQLKKELPSRRVSPDVLATVAANLLGIAIVVGHERANVIGGKAITFVKQLGR